MKAPVIKVVRADPTIRKGSRQFFKDLIAAVAKVTKAGWHQIAEFKESPVKAHNYRARLRSHFGPGKYEFCATTTDGVGVVFCRLAGAKS